MLSSLLFCVLLVLAFLLQPIQVLLGITIHFMWRPPVLSVKMRDARSTADIKTMFKEACHNIDIQWLCGHGDAGKFLSMYAWATNNPLAWADVMSMADTDAKTLHRNPPELWKETERTFSGDQLAGWMGAVANRIINHGLTTEEKEKLSAVWKNISFHGWPMLIPHYVTGKSLNLGFVWRPWQIWNCASQVKLMAWLLIGREVTGRKRYTALYHLLYALFLPALLLASPDGEVFVGKYYACSANASHSLMLDITTCFMLRHSWIMRFIMKRVGKKRSAWSTDWLALWGRYFGELTDAEESRLKFLLQSTYAKCPYDSTALSAEYFDLIHFEKQKGFPEIIPPGDRYCDYTDERHLVVPENYWNMALQPSQTAMDVIFPAGIFTHKAA